ncbi:MAG TPA: iron-containing alcohol dehydrogenase [Spirochaetes bacterium]|nr:iron-containing alcohol dehydrogenase [Spirochaetota bacterium]
MKILRVNMGRLTAEYEDLPGDWMLVGGRGLIAKIMNKEVPPSSDPLGPENKLIFACGPLAGTMAPHLGRLSVGGKSPLTLGIKEANAGGPAAQKLDRLGIRAIVVEGMPEDKKLYCLEINEEGAALVPADGYSERKMFGFVDELYEKYGIRQDGKHNPAIISIGPAGERMYKGASIALTDLYGDPSRSAGRGGLGAVMGSRGLKAVIIDDTGTAAVQIENRDMFRKSVRTWVNEIKKDVVCGLFSWAGTPFTISSNSYQGTMPGDNYTTGRPPGFKEVDGEVTRRRVWERHGKMHACMPGCVVQCSIIYYDEDGVKTSAYEYEAVSMIGTNLGISDTDAIAKFKYICDDLGVDFIEIGSAMGVSSNAGKMKIGDAESVIKLLGEVERGTDLGHTIGDGVVSTAKAFGIERVPAFKGQALPAHDPRAVKAMGVTYASSPMGADHTAGLTYKKPLAKDGQVLNSLRFQLRAAVCDTFGYCLNALPGGRTSIYAFVAELLTARFGGEVTPEDVLDIAKQDLRDELEFNKGAQFSTAHGPFPEFLKKEALPPTGNVFDVDEAEINTIWDLMEVYKEPEKIWEVRFPKIPSFLFGEGVVKKLGESAAGLRIKKALLIADPVMKTLGRTDEIQEILKKSSVDSAVYSEVEPDPPLESIERASKAYKDNECDGIIALGGGSSMDTAKATAVRVSQTGVLEEYDTMFGGKAKIKPPLPPIICVPTTSGTGSETNQYAIITDRSRDVKFTLMSDLMVPSLAVIDPLLSMTMPPIVTAETGIDALAHCVEGYVGMADEYHPYYESLALYGVKMIGRSLRKAYLNGKDVQARKDMCMAASFGGISFTKGLGLGHAISHVLGAFHHVPHGRGCALGLLCFVRVNKEACGDQFKDLSWALDRTDDLEPALKNLYGDLNIPVKLSDIGISEDDLPKIAFETSTNTVNLAANPEHVTEKRILGLLKNFY